MSNDSQHAAGLWEFRPKFRGMISEEPSLRSLVYRYYRAHFDHDQASAFAREYLSQFDPAFPAAPEMLVMMREGATLADEAADAFRRAGLPQQATAASAIGDRFLAVIIKATGKAALVPNDGTAKK